MPRYELMYIIASSVSDDQIPATIDGILSVIKGDGGEIVKEEGLGKKKLAYPIGKTRNGFYDLVTFDLDGEKLNALSTKIQNYEAVIRHIIVNTEESTRRMNKDIAEQDKMNRNRAAHTKTVVEDGVPVPAFEIAKSDESAVNADTIDQQIEEALSEDLNKI